jgi:hypothetical protein
MSDPLLCNVSQRFRLGHCLKSKDRQEQPPPWNAFHPCWRMFSYFSYFGLTIWSNCTQHFCSDSKKENQISALDALCRITRDEGSKIYATIRSSCSAKLCALLSLSDIDHQLEILQRIVWCILDENGLQRMLDLLQYVLSISASDLCNNLVLQKQERGGNCEVFRMGVTPSHLPKL